MSTFFNGSVDLNRVWRGTDWDDCSEGFFGCVTKVLGRRVELGYCNKTGTREYCSKTGSTGHTPSGIVGIAVQKVFILSLSLFLSLYICTVDPTQPTFTLTHSHEQAYAHRKQHDQR